MIIHDGKKWKLMNHEGTEVLGEFDTEEEAKKRERQINFFKYMDSKREKDGK